MQHLVVRTVVPRDAAVLPSVVGVYAGARWHERETHEMFGVDFTDGGEVLPGFSVPVPPRAVDRTGSVRCSESV